MLGELALTGAVEEEDLVARLRARDPQAWEDVYRVWFPRLYSYALHRTGERETAADIAAEVFVRALRQVDRYDPRRLSLPAWLFRLAHDGAVDHLRRRGRRPSVPLSQASREAVDAAEAWAQQGDLEWALARLTEEQRTVLLLRFFVGLSSQETGKVMGKRPGAVRALQFRALRHLRALLQGAGEEVP